MEVSGSDRSSGRELLIGEKKFGCSFEPNNCPEDAELLLAALRGCEESSPFESGGGDAIKISQGSLQLRTYDKRRYTFLSRSSLRDDLCFLKRSPFEVFLVTATRHIAFVTLLAATE